VQTWRLGSHNLICVGRTLSSEIADRVGSYMHGMHVKARLGKWGRSGEIPARDLLTKLPLNRKTFFAWFSVPCRQLELSCIAVAFVQNNSCTGRRSPDGQADVSDAELRSMQDLVESCIPAALDERMAFLVSKEAEPEMCALLAAGDLATLKYTLSDDLSVL